MMCPDKIKTGLECCSQMRGPELCRMCPYDKETYCVDELTFESLDYIRQLEAAQPQWISGKEPPKEYINKGGTLIKYLIYMPKYGIEVGNYVKPANQWFCMGIPVKATHWMPIPDGPEEK